MNRAYLLISIILLLAAHSSNAQLLQLSQDELDLSGYDHVKVIGQVEDGIYLLQSNLSLLSSRDRVGLKNRNYKIAFYDHNLIYQWFMEIRPRERSYDVDKVLFVDGSIIIFYAKEDKQNHIISYKSETIDSKGKSINYSTTSFDIPIDANFYVDQTEILFSKDKSKIAFVMSCTNEKEDNYGICYGVSDRNLSKLTTKNLNLKFDAKTYDAYQSAVANSGDFAHIGLVTEQSKENKKLLLEHYELTTSAVEEIGHKTRSILLQGKTVTECYVVFDNKNKQLAVSGFYYNSKSFLSSGVFMYQIDLGSSEASEINPSAPLSENIQVKLVSDREKDFGRGLNNYTIQKMIMRNDGGAVILAESSYINQYSYYDYFTQTFNNRSEYHFDNVVVISVNRDGSIDWNNILRKNQESRDDMGIFASYCPIVRQQEIVLLYNTNFHKNNEILAEAVTNDGTQYQVKIARAMEHITLLPRAGKQIGLNEAVIPCLQKRKLKLLKITL